MNHSSEEVKRIIKIAREQNPKFEHYDIKAVLRNTVSKDTFAVTFARGFTDIIKDGKSIHIDEGSGQWQMIYLRGDKIMFDTPSTVASD